LIGEFFSEWGKALGFLIFFGVILFLIRRIENDEYDLNAGIDRGLGAGISYEEQTIRRLNSIEKYLKAILIMLIFFGVLAVIS
jgi:hypothetical protein